MTNYIRFDWAIKRLLRDKADFGAVNGLLTCLLGKQISIMKVLESEGNQEDENAKFNRVDILVEDENGEKIIVEIQNNYQVDYYHRMLYGVSKLVTDYVKRGKEYENINKIYSINIIYFNLGRGSDYVYHGRTDFRGIHTNDILELSPAQKERYKTEKVSGIYPEYYLLRVENFNDVAKTPLDEWIYFLKNTEIPSNFTAQGLDEARQKLRIDNLTQEEQSKYYWHLEQVNYEEGVIEHQRLDAEIKGRDKWKTEGRIEGRIEGEAIGLEKGEAIGLEKGEAIGLEKGLEKGKIEVALNLLKMGISVEDIANATGLSPDQITEISEITSD